MKRAPHNVRSPTYRSFRLKEENLVPPTTWRDVSPGLGGQPSRVPRSSGWHALIVDRDPEGSVEARPAGGSEPERAAARHAFEPSEVQQAIENPGSNLSLEVIATLAPVET